MLDHCGLWKNTIRRQNRQKMSLFSIFLSLPFLHDLASCILMIVGNYCRHLLLNCYGGHLNKYGRDMALRSWYVLHLGSTWYGVKLFSLINQALVSTTTICCAKRHSYLQRTNHILRQGETGAQPAHEFLLKVLQPTLRSCMLYTLTLISWVISI